MAALKAMADRLGLVALMDRHLPLSRRPLSIGTTLWLAASNRAVWPCAKRGWAAWAPRPSLPPLVTIRPAARTSPYFWDQLEAVWASALEAIEADLTRKVIQEGPLPLETLCYDTTNFFPSIASCNARSARAQRGHSTQQRTDLRPFRLALLVARDGPMPLSAHGDEGPVVDAQQLPDSWTALRQRVERIVGHLEDLPLVYDQGNNAKTHPALVDAEPGHSVASWVPQHSPDRMAMPTRR
ncbi:MAG TPA: hypothetical protein VLQ80_03635 [Candidatus Saccharimonadia bacterium]|nr:hypothetical protein [Candidatus Saccharimonadia bacterium]